jgi:hypothetical protein
LFSRALPSGVCRRACTSFFSRRETALSGNIPVT